MMSLPGRARLRFVPLAPLVLVLGAIAACSSHEDAADSAASALPRGGPPAQVLAAESGPTREQGERIAELERESTSRVLVAFHPEHRTVSSLYLELPGALSGKSAAAAARAFLEGQRLLFGEGVAELGEPVVEAEGDWQDVHFVRQHRGVRVLDDEISVGFDPKGALRLAGGRLSRHVSDLEVVATLDRDAALAAARASVTASGHGVILEAEPPIVELVIVPGATAARLAWLVRLPLDPELSPTAFVEYRIDATSGAVLGADTGARGAGPTVVTASDLNGWSHDLQVLDGSGVLGASFLATDTTRKHRTNTCGNIRCSTFTTSDRNTWAPGVVSAHHNYAIAYDSFATFFGQGGGPGGKNGTIVSEYDYNGRLPFGSDNEGNAYWIAGFVSGGYIRYGKPNARMEKSYASAVDVVAHEYTHGVIEYTSKLVYQGESGALNESLADVFGLYAKRAACLNGWNPTCGTPFALGDFAGKNGRALRIISNPKHQNGPAAYRNLVYGAGCSPSSDNDQCGVHTNSSIPNLAFYLLNNGGVNAATRKGLPTGIGWTPAAEIWYRAALTHNRSQRTLKTSTPSMNDFAIATIAASDAIHGQSSQISHRVHCAWNAVDITPYNSDPCSLCTSGQVRTKSLRVQSVNGGACDVVRNAGAPSGAASLRDGHRSCGSAGGEEGAQWLRLEARANQRVTLHLDGMTQDLDLELFDASGKVIASSMYAGKRPETVTAVLGETSTMFVRVSAAPGSSVSAFGLVADDPTAPNAEDEEEAASCPLIPKTDDNCSTSGGCGAGQVCSATGDGSCCKQEVAVPQVCYSDADCAEDEVCGRARDEASNDALFTCAKRGRAGCLN